MTSAELLLDGFARIASMVHRAVEGLDARQLVYRPDGEANSIAWLIWHLTRVQDDHVADAAQLEQVWTSQNFAEHFGLALEPADTGYRHSSQDVAVVQVNSPDLLLAYYDAVHEQSNAFVAGLNDHDLDRIVDRSFTPAVTLGVRLVSVITDDLAHAGQAAYLRGIVERAGT